MIFLLFFVIIIIENRRIIIYMDKYNLYDKILSVTYTNIAIDANKNNGIYFNSFNKNNTEHKKS